MPTPPYTVLNPDAPSGPTQTPPQYSASDLANVRALRDAVVCGFVPGWGFTINGGTLDRPVNRSWTSGALALLMQASYAGALNLPTNVTWFWSNDGGTTYVQMGPASIITWNGDVITAVSTGAGLWVGWLGAYHKGLYAGEYAYNHAALVGPAAHGLGTMSTQNSNAINVNGGTVVGVSMYNSAIIGTPVMLSTKISPSAPPSIPNGGVWDWNANGIQWEILAGFSIANLTNITNGEIKRLVVSGGGTIAIGNATVSFNWAPGHPVWGPNGTLINCVALNPTYVLGTSTPF